MNRNDKPASDLDPLAFLMGGGEMGRLIRSMDWSKTSLGPVTGWPQSLRTTVSICLASDLPICVIWGPGLVQLYNDAYRVICGDKHPRSMGQNFPECWSEAWSVIGEAHDSALTGDTAFLESQHIFLERHGYVEECFFTFSFSPIRDEAGRVGGLFHPVIEMTTKMLSERRARALRDLTAYTSKAKSVDEVLALSAETFADCDLDLPFTLLYALDPDGEQARLVGASGLKADAVASLSTVCLVNDEHALWPLAEVIRSGAAVQINDVGQRIGTAALGPCPEPPSAALALPIIRPGADRPAAIFIAGISPRLPMNEAYRTFYDLLASGVTAAVANAGAFDDARRRAKALAELDRAKTVFFSNVSHEFRTPLTLMLGPIEDALAASSEPLPPLQRERLEVVQRNGLRLERLVNSLLDFSRIEAGRVRAAYEPTDLAHFTADLASNFRSACESAGLELYVDCPPLGEPAFVDRSMWEKVVLNLLSNAFKFTFEGRIAVSLRQVDGAAELRVQDTGTGIPAADIPLMFERFHRVENARGRTHEGSGIGLALVQELVKLHGGSITVESEIAQGTTFIVRVPLGSQHLLQDQVGSKRTAAQPTTGANSFVVEALRWLPYADQRAAAGSELPSIQGDPTGPAASTQRADDDRPLVLVADDNADMRQYIVRLLGQHYRTEAVPDGEAALAAARARTPDLILTDVMMPRLDGFGLLQALRADPRTSGVPVILLSARAGEESRIEGMQEGADDYMVKPFSAKELLARVTAHLKMAQMRRESSEALRASDEHHRLLFEQTVDGIFLADAAGRYVDVNTAGCEMLGYSREEVLARTHSDMLEPDEWPRIEPEIARFAGGQVVRSEWRFRRKDGSVFVGEISGRRLPDGRVQGILRDITERKAAETALQASEEQFRALVRASSDVVYRMNADWTEMRHLQGREFIADTQEPNRSWLEKYIHPDDQQHVTQTIREAVRTKSAFELEHRVLRIDGTLGWTFSRAIPLMGSDGTVVEWFGMASDVTPHKQAEEALRRSEQKFRTLFESMDEGYCLIEMIFDADARPADYRFLEINPAFEKHTGLRNAQGKRMLELAPDHDAHWFEIYGRVAVTGEPVRFVNEAKALEGRWFDVYAFRLGDNESRKVAILFNDISDRKASENELRASENRSRTILESITDGFFALDSDWRFTYINAAGERFLDRTPGDLIGKSLWDEFPGTVGSEFERVYRRVVAGPVGESFTAYYPNFHRWYEVTAYPAPNGLSVYFRDVTDRRQVEQERQQFAALVDASSDFIGVAGLDLRGLYLNRAGEELIGLEHGQVASIGVLDCFPESERDRVIGLIAGSEGGEPVVVDTWFQHLRTGQLIPVSWAFLRLRDTSGNVSGYATVTRDLTERNHAEERLRASEERRRLALDAAELGMWHVEPATRALQTDTRFRAIFGTTDEWTDYLQVFAVIHPDDLPAVQAAVAAATRPQDPIPYAIEYRIVHPNGSLRWVFAKGRTSIEGTGPSRRATSFNGTVADITEQKKGEEERERLVARLQEQDQRKDEFLATLAHELRNPLAPIRNGLQIMRLAKGDAKATEQVRSMMERQLGQMVHLIDDLLDLSRISRGAIDLRKVRIELAKAIELAIEATRPSIEQAGHELVIEVPPGPIFVDADLTRLAQVFSNLLNNAAKYTQRGGRIRLSVQHLGTEAVVSVQDNGIGIPPHMLQHVFEMFTQVDRHLERSQGGLGVGLSIVQRLVQMHGGSVEARSDGNGRGSEFVVRLPVALSLVRDKPPEEANLVRPIAHHRILVVDDNVDAAMSLAMMLTMMGNETLTAHGGQEALNVAATFRPDVMFLDIGMPKLNGYEVCRRLRQEAWGKDMLVIALTGWGQDEDKRLSLEAGFDSHMVKPVLAPDLEKLLAGTTAAGA